MQFLHHGTGWDFSVGVDLGEREVWLCLLPPRRWYFGRDVMAIHFAIDAYGFGFFELQIG